MNRKWIVAVGIALVIGVALGITLSNLHSRPTSPAAATPGAGERKVLYWHDPMVPGTKFDKPGKSPFMDMQLVPVYADEAGAAVRIDTNVAQNFGVRLGKVEKRDMRQQLHAVGSVSVDERRIEVVQARAAGTIVRLYVKAPFETVRRGQSIAEVLAPEWRAAQQEYLALIDAASASAQRIREAARERLAVLGVPEPTIQAIEAERRAQPTTAIYAPIDGVVTELAVREGSAFAAGSALLQIANLDAVWVQAQVPESQRSLVSVDSKVRVQATGWPDDSFDGKVIAVLPNVDAQTRTVPVRIEVRNADRKLAAGMFVSLDFVGPARAAQLVVPSEAVIVTGERSIVIAARQQGGFEVIDVTTGGESGGYTTILKGLAEGQSVVLSGQFLIDSEASLKSAINRLDAGPGAAEPPQ